MSNGKRDGRGAQSEKMPEKGDSSRARWRKIEAMREKRALKEALADIWFDDPDLDDEIFGLEEGHDSYYSADEKVDDADLDSEITEDGDDDFVDEELEE